MAEDNNFPVVMQNIPDKWEHYTVVDFLEVCCDDEDVEISPVKYFQNEKSVAKTGFSHAVDFHKVAEKVKKEMPNINIIPLPAADGLIFTDIAPGVTIDMVMQHFNSVQAGAASTQKKHFYRLNGCIVLKMNNAEVIADLVKTVVPGVTISSVEVFYDVFQGEALRKLGKLPKPNKPSKVDILSGRDSPESDSPESDDNSFLTCEDPDSDSPDDDDDDDNLDIDDIDITEESSTNSTHSSLDSENVSDRNGKEKEIPVETSEYIFDQNDYYKAQLLQKRNFGEDLENCTVEILLTKPVASVVFKGRKTDIDVSKIKMFELLRLIDKKVSGKLQTPFLEILKSEKGEGYLSSIFGVTEEVIGYIDDDMLAVAGIDTTKIPKLLRFTESQLLTEKITIKDSYRHFVLGSTWHEVKKKKEDKFLIKLVQEEDVIVIYGLNGDVGVVKKDILELLHSNQHDTKKISLTGAQSRCIALYFKASISSCGDILRDCHGYLKDELTESSYNIELTGSPAKVQQVLNKLEEIKKAVWHGRVLLKRDITQDSAELKLLVCGLKNANQRRFKIIFETENKCCIEFLNLKPEQQNYFSSYRAIPPRNPKPRISKKHYMKKPFSAHRSTCSVNFHQATITVKRGDITREKADVLVNVLSPHLNLKSTAVGVSFCKSGGQQFEKAFETEKNKVIAPDIVAMKMGPLVPVGTVLETASCGHLSCKYVLHVLLDKYKDTASLQVLSKSIRNILSRCNTRNASSVALPSLGVGKLYGFPPDKMAAASLQELQDSIQDFPNVKNVSFVIYDDDVYKEFENQMSNHGYSPPHSPGRGAATSLSTDSESDSDDDFTIHSVQDDQMYESVETGIQLYCESKVNCDKAKNNLIKYLKSTYLYNDSIKDSTILHLTKYIVKDIKAQAERLNVSITLPIINRKDIQKKHIPEIKLQGESQAVKDAKVKIQEILLKEIHKSHKYNDISSEGNVQKRGTLEHLHHMALKTDQDPPAYWKNSLTLKSKVMKMMDLKNILEPISSKSALYLCIENLVQKTWHSDKVGHGRDAKNLHHKSIEVISIERVENLALYHRYCERRCELFTKAVDKKIPCTNIDRIPNSSGPMLTTKLAGLELQQDIYHEVNEHYAFHGTHSTRVKAICHEGLDIRTSRDKNLFGSAIYMSESSTKADQYADPRDKREPGPKKMILGRILLGNTYATADKNPPKYRKPPCLDLQHLDPNCSLEHGFFDSVMAHRSWNFREFAVYDNNSVYPEYIITYNRV